jgi:hypothetical protein
MDRDRSYALLPGEGEMRFPLNYGPENALYILVNIERLVQKLRKRVGLPGIDQSVGILILVAPEDLEDNRNASTASDCGLGDSYANDTGLDRETFFTGPKHVQVRRIEFLHITDLTALPPNRGWMLCLDCF